MRSRSQSDGSAGRLRRSDAFWWGLVLAGLLICWAAIVGGPRLCAGGGPLAPVGAACSLALAKLCHQDPSRCLWLGDQPLGVCARCAGIWGGAVLGVLLLPLARGMDNRRIPHRAWLGVAAAAVLLDVASEWLGLRHPIAWLRLTTGGMLGLAAACTLMPAILLAVDEKRRKEAVPCNQQTRAATI